MLIMFAAGVGSGPARSDGALAPGMVALLVAAVGQAVLRPTRKARRQRLPAGFDFTRMGVTATVRNRTTH